MPTPQLVAKDNQRNVGAHVVGEADDQPDQTAKHEIHESEQQGPNLL